MKLNIKKIIASFLTTGLILSQSFFCNSFINSSAQQDFPETYSQFCSEEDETEEIQGYFVYKYSSATKKWVKLYDLSKKDNTDFLDKNVKSGNIYIYRIKPYYISDGKKIVYEEDIQDVYHISRPKAVSTKGTVSGKSVTLKWSETNCSGYRIYMYKNGSWKVIRNLSKDKTICKLTNLKGSEYSFKVVPVLRSSGGNIYKSLDNAVIKADMKLKKIKVYKPESEENKDYAVKVNLETGELTKLYKGESVTVNSGYSHTAMISFRPVINAVKYDICLKKNGEWYKIRTLDEAVDFSVATFNNAPLKPLSNYSICIKAINKNGKVLSKKYKNFKTTSSTLFRVKPAIACYTTSSLENKIGTLKTNGLYSGRYVNKNVVRLDCFYYAKNTGKVSGKYVYIKSRDCRAIAVQSLNGCSPLNQYLASFNKKDGQNSCGPASLACLLDYEAGKNLTARTLRTFKYSNEGMNNLSAKAKKYGKNLFWHSDSNSENKINSFLQSGKCVLPLLSYKKSSIVPYRAYGHFVVICGSDKNNYFVADSLYNSVNSKGYIYRKNRYFSQGLRIVPKKTVVKSIASTGYRYTLGVLD